MLKELKKQSFLKILPLAVILLLVSAGLLYMTDFGIFKLIGGAQPLDELPADQIAGKYVSYTVDLLYDSYAYTTESSNTNPEETTVSSEYIIPVGYDENGFFMGMYARKPLTYDFDKLLESSLLYLNDESGPPSETYEVKGTVMPIDEETIGYFYEAVGYEEGDAEYQAMFQPYFLKVDYLGRQDNISTVAMTFMSVFCLFFGLSMPIRALAGGYQKDLKKLGTLNGEGELNRLESWYQYVPSIHGFRIDEKWAMFNKGAYTRVLDTPAIVWAYQSVITHRTNGIKTGTSYGLILYTKDSKNKIEIPMRNQDEAIEILDYIGNRFPNIVLGYDKDRESRFKKDPAGFAAAELEMINKENN